MKSIQKWLSNFQSEENSENPNYSPNSLPIHTLTPSLPHGFTPFIGSAYSQYLPTVDPHFPLVPVYQFPHFPSLEYNYPQFSRFPPHVGYQTAYSLAMPHFPSYSPHISTSWSLYLEHSNDFLRSKKMEAQSLHSELGDDNKPKADESSTTGSEQRGWVWDRSGVSDPVIYCWK